MIGSGFKRWTEGSYTPGQIEVARDFTNSFILLSGAYRSGKSEMLARIGIRHALCFDGAKVGVFRQHLASLKRTTLTTFLELVNLDWVADWSNSDLILTLKNGSRVVFMGCDFADRIGSLELSQALVDEAHEVSVESLGMLIGRLSGRLVPSSELERMDSGSRVYVEQTLDKRQMYLACNPKSTIHHLYKHFIESPKPKHKVYTSNSISNPNLPLIYLLNNLSAYVLPDYDEDWVIEQVNLIRRGVMPHDGLHLKDALTPFGQRNLLGLWVAMEGAVFSSYISDVHLVDKVDQSWGEPVKYYGAVDWGFNNPRIVIAAEYGEHRLAVVDYWAEPGKEPTVMLRKMNELNGRYVVARWFLPPDQPGLIKMARRSLGSSKVRKAKNAVLAGIDAVGRRFSNGSLVLVNTKSKACKLADDEISGYEWANEKDTGDFKDTPLKINDHFPDAIRYLVYSLDYKNKLVE